jgi:toxin YoeB
VFSITGGLRRFPEADTIRQLGKPEPLQHGFAGYWSRRMTDEHRIVYRIEGDAVLIAQLRNHY